MFRNQKLFAWPCALSLLGVLPSLLDATPRSHLAGPGASEDRELGTTNSLNWTTVARGFDPNFWGEQEKAPDRIRFTNGNPLQAEIRLRDGDTGVTGSDRDRERAELFLFYRVLDQWFRSHRHVRLSYELKLGSDFDVLQEEAGSRRVFQIKSSKGSGKPIFDVNIEGGLMQIRHNPTPNSNSKPVVLAEGPAPDPRKREWLPVRLEAKFTTAADGYLLIRFGKLTAHYQGPTQHSAKLNNFKIGEYRNKRYSSGTAPHLIRDAWLRVAP